MHKSKTMTYLTELEKLFSELNSKNVHVTSSPVISFKYRLVLYFCHVMIKNQNFNKK